MEEIVKESSEDSSIKIGSRNTYEGDTAIGKNAKIIKNVIDNSITYEENRKDMSALERNSIWTINKYGEKKPLILGILFLIAGVLAIIAGITSILGRANSFVSWMPSWLSVSNEYGYYFIVAGIVIAIIGVYLISLVEYKYQSKCPKCSRHYALKEIGRPITREVKAHDGIKKTTRRTYKCQFCNSEFQDLNTETIPYDT